MTGDRVSPPTEWFEATECPRDGCDEVRFVPLAMDLHLVRDHAPRRPRTVAEQIDSGGRR
ncbi:hypothetical protein EXE53_25230 [Halorubrum sp. SD626R]|uniref:hypothetical protein n=1 Tax=Halorubrum sp. SD626R TaxID=1419722 RepID=UPI0010F6A066|nr:hypothetical protein [Halorubrum sp. SD626R]TKX77691.1 hypothetical protein EXE53_25230 [Halorubrum sp. SD626R]